MECEPQERLGSWCALRQGEVMAGEWLKVEKDTPDKPEILAIAADLNIHPDEAFGKCFRFWRWVDSHTVDGHAKGVTAASLDTTVGCAGFAQALVRVGWLKVRVEGIEVPHFEYHIASSEKKRQQDRKRQQKHRASKESVTPMSHDVTRDKRDTLVAPSSSYSNSHSNSSSEGNGGVGERGPPDNDEPPRAEFWPAWLASEWKVYYAGTAPSQMDHTQLTKFFAELIVQGALPIRIRNEIRAPGRDKTEAPWDFRKRFKEVVNGTGKNGMADVHRVRATESDHKRLAARTKTAASFRQQPANDGSPLLSPPGPDSAGPPGTDQCRDMG